MITIEHCTKDAKQGGAAMTNLQYTYSNIIMHININILNKQKNC